MSHPDGKVSILLVDDRPDKLLALEAVLEDLGQDIVRAYSGREALRHVLNQDFAVILLDVNMPGMDGFETAQLIRQRKSSEHTPIIFITAMGDDLHMTRGYSLGAVDYIETPVVPDILRSKVGVFVDLFRKTEQVKRQADSLRRRAAQLQSLAAASVTINSALSIDQLLQTITDTARQVIGAHQAITVFIDPRPGQGRPRTQSVASYSDRYAEWRGKLLQLDAVVDTLAFRSHNPTRLTEAELLEHPDWDIVRLVRIPPIRGGMMAAPLTGRDGTRLGVVYLADRGDPHAPPGVNLPPAPFTADDEVIIVQLAQMASIALENSLFAEEREANRIKDEFLSTLSHELRTPLNAILGWTQLLKMQSPRGEIGHGLDVIERNAKSQTKLIEDLLDVSRISAGKLRIHPRHIPLTPVIHAALDAVRPAADAKKIQLACDVPAVDERVNGDPDRLQQVVWNLLSNAVKFTPSNGTVAVSLARVEGQIEIAVRDTGLGIAPNFLPYVFDRFRQADSSSTRSHGGLGIGLTIVRHIVELHGGAVRADSAGEGQGSTFTVRLPVAAAADLPAPYGENGGAHAPAVQAPSLAGLQLLLVDDEPDAREVLAEILKRAGADVSTAASVAEARLALEKLRPAVLISDIAMPEADGYALIQGVRRLSAEHGGAIPAIALTAHAREEDRIRALAAGFHAHVVKPVEPVELISVVARIANEFSPRDANALRDARDPAPQLKYG